MIYYDKKIEGIAKLLLLAKSEYELMNLLDDMLTVSEVDKIHERIRIIACLKNGMSQRETQKKTDAGIATITRGAGLLKKPKLIIDHIISAAQKKSWWYKLFWRS